MAAIRPNPTLSEDLISEILVRVPVKLLLCLQLVCKDWLSLIKHPAFVKSQLLRAMAIETDQTLILTRFLRHEGEKISLLHVDSRQIVADLKFPSPRNVVSSTIVGSANGIVCVASTVVTETIRFHSIYLWNPAIRQSKLIPSATICYEFHELESLGFGYDPIGHDFKIARVAPLPFAEVYSANKNVWREVPDPIDTPIYNDFDVCVNGFLCGIGHYGMVTFDMNKEVLNCAIKLPVGNHLNDRIIEFNKSIAFIVLLKGLYDGDETDPRLDKTITMWSLDDDACLGGGGVEPSWTIMFSISIDFVTPEDLFFDLYLGYFSNGDLSLLISNDIYKWISCNADKKEGKIVPLSVEMAAHHYCRSGCFKYTESLVSFPGFKQVIWNAGENDN